MEDVLARDDVNDILEKLNQIKPKITDMIVIYMDRETKKYNFQITDGTLESTAIWMLENTKLDVLNSEVEE